ncbi:MAG TPA: CARDB domain-containing protein, partial [Vicinamibacterales bacterium]|nr:CARDB domain-containing protein [Vicinamibacterales bacterium]
FTVRRSGDTSEALSIAYVVNGTAGSGLDYVALPGTLTIPAGSSEASILVEPIDDTAVESDETVTLTLSADAGYDVGSPSSATVAIVSDDRPPDLLVTSMNVPSTAAAGASVTISDTTKNQESASSEPSETGFYLSINTQFDAGDLFLGSRAVSALAAGAVESRSTPMQIPQGTAAGIYYVLAKADWNNLILETQESNNTRASGSISIGPDLMVAAVSAPSTAAAGGTITVGDTTKNNGAELAPTSVTAFYLSANSTWESSDIRLGSHPVDSLSGGASQTASTALTIPASTTSGVYYVVARADDGGSVAETRETNNLSATSQLRIGVDLVLTAVSGPATAAAGASIAIADTTTNQGGAPAAPSTTAFYLSLDAAFSASDVRLGTRPVPSIASGQADTGSTILTLPSSTAPGIYYVVARADDGGVITEASETNNTKASTSVKVGPDLIVTTLAPPGIGGAGETMIIADGIKNIGGATAPSTSAVLYLSTNQAIDGVDVVLAHRVVPALAAGVTDSSSTTVTIPLGTSTGIYYILERSDADNTASEAVETNNTGVSGLIKIGPDLTVAALTAPSTSVAGASIVVTDTTTNTGGGAAEASMTSFYLSNNSTLDASDPLIGSRSVTALGRGMTDVRSTSVPLPAALSAGTYYLFAKGDGGGTVAETTETNNTRMIAIKITAP